MRSDGASQRLAIDGNRCSFGRLETKCSTAPRERPCLPRSSIRKDDSGSGIAAQPRITFFNLEASHQAERAPLGAQEIIVFLPPFLDLRHVSLVRSVAHTGHHRQEGEATLVCAQHPNPS